MYALSICMSEIIVYCLQPSTQLFSVSMLKHTDSPSYFMPQYVKSKRSKWLQQKYCEVQACVCAQGTLSILQLQATQKQQKQYRQQQQYKQQLPHMLKLPKIENLGLYHW